MSIHERFREIGMLIAVGMNLRRVFGMIVLEAVMLTGFGALLGMTTSWATVLWMGHMGIDLGAFGQGMKAFGYDAVIYPVITGAEFLGISVIVVVTAVLATIYPALKALRIPPAVAIRP
jgi:ABC-type antimicrobial peptide transport system permease subunit